MAAANPWVIRARNYLCQEAINAATAGDLSVLHDLLAAIRTPYARPADLLFDREAPGMGATGTGLLGAVVQFVGYLPGSVFNRSASTNAQAATRGASPRGDRTSARNRCLAAAGDSGLDARGQRRDAGKTLPGLG